MSKRNPETRCDDLESEIDYASDLETKRKRFGNGMDKMEQRGVVCSQGRSDAKASFDSEHSRFERQKRRLMSLDAYSRHKELINHYFLYYAGATKRLKRDTSKDRNDYDVLLETHRFLWDEKELSEAAEKSWEARLAKKYYDKLFKEYCIADLTHYKRNKIALRWRIEDEVRSGKGQFECGSKHCSLKEDLTSWEVNFGYFEKGEKRNALVKLRLCPQCSTKLNFYSKKRRARSLKKRSSLAVTENYSDEDRHNHPEDQASQEPRVSPKEEAVSTGSGSQASEARGIHDEHVKLREEAEKMALIWKKPKEQIDPDKINEADLDEFLEDMFM